MKKLINFIVIFIASSISNLALSNQVTPTGKIENLSFVQLNANSNTLNGTCEIIQFGASKLKNPIEAYGKINQYGLCEINAEGNPLFKKLSACFISSYSGNPQGQAWMMAEESISTGGGSTSNLFFEWVGGMNVTWNCFLKK